MKDIITDAVMSAACDAELARIRSLKQCSSVQAIADERLYAVCDLARALEQKVKGLDVNTAIAEGQQQCRNDHKRG